ncbi:MAG: glutamine--tRNA ligase/YqeY domain fusion protein [Lentisphaerae bacterium]|nr:glutamine--tRNA ligase/YqeY domain fusion protein [Lentisphaerota bacterium]
MPETEHEPLSDFIREKVAEDLRTGKYDGRVVTRFPPEPNGYLHIGHAKAICLDFGIAEENKGVCHLRFDDTNPVKEDVEYVDSIIEDVHWLGFDWGEHLYYASDYFEQMYEGALKLIRDEKAYICELSPDAFKEYRGVPTRPGKASPGRSRSIEENLDLFQRMRGGEFKDGTYVLRARLDMESPNLHMRDPALYRIKHAHHHRTGDAWCLYPTYDFAHGFEDSIERVTHSLCTLEFEVHRPLYDWLLNALEVYRPEQTEFARLNLSYTVMSKRKMLELVEGGYVSGWDDPRLPTLCGLRRRGYTAASIRRFCRGVGITKVESLTDITLLEHHIKEELNRTAPRVMGVLDPLKVVIENYPEEQVEELEAVNNPEDASAGTRQIPFSRELYIEREDFREDANRKFYRLAPGREVRLRYAYFVTCTDVVKDADGTIREVRCSYDPATRGGDSPDGRRVKGTIHWVSAAQAGEVDVRLYDRLFSTERPEDVEADGDFKDSLNPDSLKIVRAKVEPAIVAMTPGTRCQFERKGYFCCDTKDSTPGQPVFNQIVPLRDSWGKQAQ